MNSTKFKNFRNNFTPSKWTKYFLTFSAGLVLIGAIMLCVLGFNLGLDFTGGNIVKIEVGQNITDEIYNTVVDESKTILAENGLTLSLAQKSGTGATSAISIQYQNKAGVADMSEINQAVITALRDVLPSEYTVNESETKSATASSELLINAMLAIFIAVIFIMIYVSIRFEVLSGVAAVIALFHDVLVMCACVLIFRIEVNSSFIAAVITILGYSINNTIVVFDRLRENLKRPSLDKLSNKELADMTVRQTLGRTINTSITTILAVLLLSFIGIPQMTQFVIPILIGLIAGTYSSVFIAAPLWAKIAKDNTRNSIRQKMKNKENKLNATNTEQQVVEATASPYEE